MTDTFGEAGISKSPLRGLAVNRVLAAGRRLPLWFSGLDSTDLIVKFFIKFFFSFDIDWSTRNANVFCSSMSSLFRALYLYNSLSL